MQRWPIFPAPALHYFNGLLNLSFSFDLLGLTVQRSVCIWVPQQQPLDIIERLLVQNTSATLFQCVFSFLRAERVIVGHCLGMMTSEQPDRIWWYTPVAMATYTVKMGRTLHRLVFFPNCHVGCKGCPISQSGLSALIGGNLQAKFM